MASPSNEEVSKSSIVAGRSPTKANLGEGVDVGGDIITPGQGFSSSALYGNQRTFGARIPAGERVFASQREPMLKWLVSFIASDIYDNGFRVVEVGNEEDDTLNDIVQAELIKLNAKKNLTRLTVFERRWGTSFFLLSYSTNRNKVDWASPLYDNKGKLPTGIELLQITPYPKSRVTVTEEVIDTTDLRLGQPKFYNILRGSLAIALKVHWSRIIHVAPRLDEHPFWGLSVMDPLWDDVTGWRNIRWAFYQMIWRYGMGFPHFSFEGATQEDLDNWEAAGGLDDFFARAVFLSNEKAKVNFVGLEGATVNPKEYVSMVYQSMSTGSRISQDILKGVSAGAVTGSETNLKEYAKLISNEQSDIEYVPIELIRRLMETGQIDFDYENKAYALEWVSAFELGEVDYARVQLQKSMARKNETEYLTIDEVRVRAGEDPLTEGGEAVLGLERMKRGQSLNIPPEED